MDGSLPGAAVFPISKRQIAAFVIGIAATFLFNL